MAVSNVHAAGHVNHARPANFGQLNSAIARGDLPEAQSALTALTEATNPAALAAKARGSLDAVGGAIAAGDIDGAKRSLADFRAGKALSPTLPADGSVATGPVSSPGGATSEGLALVVPVPTPEADVTEMVVALLTGNGSTVELTA